MEIPPLFLPPEAGPPNLARKRSTSDKSDYQLFFKRARLEPSLADKSKKNAKVDIEKRAQAKKIHAQKIPLDTNSKVLTAYWKDKKTGKIAKETIERVEAGEAHVDALLQRFDALMDYEPKSQEERIACEAQKQILRQTIENLPSTMPSWMRSGDSRNIFPRSNQFSASKNPNGILGARNAWQKQALLYRSIGGMPVNMRHHACQIGGERSHWLRLGVMGDMSNGHFNIKELTNLSNALSSGDLELASIRRASLVNSIAIRWQGALASGNESIDGSAAFALFELGFTNKEIEHISDIIHTQSKSCKAALTTISQIQPHDSEMVTRRIQTSCRERQLLLEQQMLLYVHEQSQAAEPKNLKDNVLSCFHVSLLNSKKNALQGGWIHNEKNLAEEMAHTFAAFNGKKIVFDTGPFIDPTGIIHLPPTPHCPRGTVITLKTYFANTSVQGYTKNAGEQKALNARALIALVNAGHPINEKCTQALLGKTTDYSSTADLLHWAENQGLAISTGCLSAKDRTGLESALIVKRKMDQHHFSKKSQSKMIQRQLSQKSPASLVAHENTGQRVLKVTPWGIEGLTKRSANIAQGVFARLKLLWQQGIDWRKKILETWKS